MMIVISNCYIDGRFFPSFCFKNRSFVSYHFISLKRRRKINDRTPTEDLTGLFCFSLSLLRKHREVLDVTNKLFQQYLATVVSDYDE